MKALSVRQPWADLLIDGEKTVELRSWKTPYRGPILVAASAKPFQDYLTGHAIGIVELIDIRERNQSDWRRACCEPGLAEGFRYAWIVRSLGFVNPFPIKGRLSLWEIDDRTVRRALRRRKTG